MQSYHTLSTLDFIVTIINHHLSSSSLPIHHKQHCNTIKETSFYQDEPTEHQKLHDVVFPGRQLHLVQQCQGGVRGDFPDNRKQCIFLARKN